MEKTQKIEIARRTIVFTIFFILGLYLLWMVRELLYSLFIAFIIMSVIKPLVIWLAKYKIPRAFSTLIIFIILFTLIGFGLSAVIPSFLTDMTALFRNFSSLTKNIDPNIKQFINGKTLDSYIPNATAQVLPFLR